MTEYGADLRSILVEANHHEHLPYGTPVIWHKPDRHGNVVQDLRGTIDREPPHGISGYVRIRIPVAGGKVIVRHARLRDLEVIR